MASVLSPILKIELLLNYFFQSVFNTDDPPLSFDFPDLSMRSNHQLTNIQLIPPELATALNNIVPSKASGPDKIPGID